MPGKVVMVAASTTVVSLRSTPESNAASALDASTHWLAELENQGYLSLRLSVPNLPAAPPLSAWLDTSVENQLQALGACPRPSYVDNRPGCVLPDQLYRARMLGFGGLAVAFPSLHAFARLGTLSADDSLALGEWCEHAERLKVPTRFHAEDGQLKVFLAPVSLAQVSGARFPLAPWSLGVQPLPSKPELESTSPDAREPVEPAPTSSPRSLRTAMRTALCDLDPPADDRCLATGGPDVVEPVTSQHGRSVAFEEGSGQANQPTPQSDACSAAKVRSESLSLEQGLPEPSVLTPLAPLPVAPDATLLDDAVAPTSASSDNSEWASAVTDVNLETENDTAALRILVENLQATTGAHSWADLEQLFVDSYLPLQRALRDGTAPSGIVSVLKAWASDFAESYEQAFKAMQANRGKRPNLVLDAPQRAFQLGRQTETERLKLVLVDAMRADLAPLVRQKLTLQMMHTAECVAQGLLWAALPATTSTQMELVARGTDGLRHFTGELTESQLMGRGNDLRRLRPVRVGTHRMHKLDIVQYLTQDEDCHDQNKLEQYAAEIATSVGRFLRQQEPNTLVYMFGDHGFGGDYPASPEKVLTPYLGWRINE